MEHFLILIKKIKVIASSAKNKHVQKLHQSEKST